MGRRQARESAARTGFTALGPRAPLDAIIALMMVVDPGMSIAYELAQQLGEVERLPPWLESPAQCATLVALAEQQAMGRVMEAWSHMSANGYDDRILMQGFADGFGKLAEDPESAPGVEPALQRATVLLRLWSGCISAAKMIAVETRNGPNTTETRAEAFSGIDLIAKQDAVYRAGVVAAPTFKRTREQPYSFDGVPADSPVRLSPA